ncbi:prolyl oligopeptidase family serine peptidase [Verrucomicrobiaceae bacterium 5K15]|uniref:Prolyl oligopeptidase family serine peptidase n=1 Tax=Oceaniferula flava TaxID=2800421 RepID=A0AAE2SF75_9BACT|nr:PHB depolymerase family esterase [Oceaniferula flavus]MBK1855231.1 prolyl oligopeptidase family serine peptidase [Oceaniferula flavus]MBM1136537.1 prolyl oligopeptidase family serine peptidase [Oceaniferula flavus]
MTTKLSHLLLLSCSCITHATGQIVYHDTFDGDGLETNAGIGGGGRAVASNGGGWLWADDGNLTAGTASTGNRVNNFYSDSPFFISEGFTLEIIFDLGATGTTPYPSNHFSIGLAAEDETTKLFDTASGDSSIAPADGIGISLTPRNGSISTGIIEWDADGNAGIGETSNITPFATTAGTEQSFILNVAANGSYTYSYGGINGSGTTNIDLNLPYFFRSRTQGSADNAIREVKLTTTTPQLQPPYVTASSSFIIVGDSVDLNIVYDPSASAATLSSTPASSVTDLRAIDATDAVPNDGKVTVSVQPSEDTVYTLEVTDAVGNRSATTSVTVLPVGTPTGTVLVTRQAPDAILPSSDILLKNINRNIRSTSYPYGTEIEKVNSSESIGGTTFVVSGTGSYDLGAITFKSAIAQSFGSAAAVRLSFYLNTGDSGTGDTSLEQNEFIADSDEIFSLAGLSMVTGDHITFNLSSPLTNLQKGREYGVVINWLEADEHNTLSLWRSNNKDRRDGGALAETASANIDLSPSRVQTIEVNNDPVIFISSRNVPDPGDAIVRGTLEGWGSHLKYAADIDGYFSTPKQLSGLDTWRVLKIFDGTDAATMTVEEQVQYPAGTQVGKVYVPDAYEPDKPIGLLIFVNTALGAFDVNRFESVMDDHYLIGASAEQTSNANPDPWRIARILDLTVSLMDEYEVDPERVYIAGSSGGALISALCTLLYPDVYHGAVCVAHALPINYYYGLYGESWTDTEWDEFVAQNQRFVWMAGEEDASASFFRSYYPQWWSQGFIMDEYWVPGLGHSYPDASIVSEAFRFIDAPVQANRMTNYHDWSDEQFRMMTGRSHSSVPQADTLPHGDMDGDGRSNIEEFVFGGDPRQLDEGGSRQVTITDGALSVRARYPMSGARLKPTWSTDLNQWKIDDLPLSELSPDQADGQFSTYRYQMLTGEQSKAFFRFEAEEVME